jgi:hypothetical protein
MNHHTTPMETQARDKPEVRSGAQGSLVLRPIDDGWRLSGAHDAVLFESHGHDSRRARIEITTDAGDLDVTVRR